MKILVAVASKHGSTQEIAYAIQQSLKTDGLEAEVANVEDIGDLGNFDAFVLGSAIYGGKWLETAVEFAEKHAIKLGHQPTWLFSSGPVGRPLRPSKHPEVLEETVMNKIKPRDHHVFNGKINYKKLSPPEKLIARAVPGSEGDFRDWQAVKKWTGTIAHSLKTIA